MVVNNPPIMWEGRDVTAASFVALMYDQRLKTPQDLLSRIQMYSRLEGEVALYQQLFRLRLDRFLRMPGIPDHPDVYAATSHTREDVLASKEDLMYRSRLFLRCLKTKDLLHSTEMYRITVGLPLLSRSPTHASRTDQI